MKSNYKMLVLLPVLSPTVAALGTGIYANLLTSRMLSGNIGWKDAFFQMGNLNFLLIAIALPILLPTILRRKYKTIYREVEQRLTNEFFKLVGNCICFPNECKNISIHYFRYRKKGGTQYLQKVRRYCFESESLPGNYPLEMADINTDNLVMCKAFNKKSPIYEELPPTHMDRYGEKTKHLIDPNIKWVLACPVWFDSIEKSPNGVLVFFGSQPPIDKNNRAQENMFKQLIVQSSIIMSNIATLKETSSWEEA